MEKIIQKHMNRKGADLDVLEQFQIYEVSIAVCLRTHTYRNKDLSYELTFAVFKKIFPISD